jgi:hypothetical protein
VIPQRPLLAACLAAMLLATSAFSLASGGAEEWVVLRIHQAGGDITVEAPRALLTAMSQNPTGATLPLGHFQGKAVRMSADRLIRMLRDLPAGSKEALLFTRQTDQGPMAFYAVYTARRVPPRSTSPMLLSFDMERKGASPVRLLLPMVGFGTLSSTILTAAGFQADADVSTLIERGLESASQVGTGAMLKATASDASLSVSLR